MFTAILRLGRANYRPLMFTGANYRLGRRGESKVRYLLSVCTNSTRLNIIRITTKKLLGRIQIELILLIILWITNDVRNLKNHQVKLRFSTKSILDEHTIIKRRCLGGFRQTRFFPQITRRVVIFSYRLGRGITTPIDNKFKKEKLHVPPVVFVIVIARMYVRSLIVV